MTNSYSNLAFDLSQQSDLAGASQFYQHAVVGFADLERQKSATREARVQYAFALKRLGAIRIAGGALAPPSQFQPPFARA